MTEHRSARPLRVVVSGPGGTGKTTLTRRLAGHFGVPWSAEAVRTYLDRKGAPLTYRDVAPIARLQIAMEDAATAQAAALVFHDTDLVSTCVCSRHYYGDCPGWVHRLASERRADLYLLCAPDVPWVADGLQRDGRHQREQVHALLQRDLQQRKCRVVSVHGVWEERRHLALQAVNDQQDRERTEPGHP